MGDGYALEKSLRYVLVQMGGGGGGRDKSVVLLVGYDSKGTVICCISGYAFLVQKRVLILDT